MHDRALLESRSWAWLESCIEGLLNAPVRVVDSSGRGLPSTRLGWALAPPIQTPQEVVS